MYAMRRWSARHSNTLKAIYHQIENALVKLYPRLEKIGLEKIEKPLMFIEKPAKSFFFDSQSCGQCTLGSTGMSCPMNCPKTIRNGPCGGVRANGKCEVKPEMDCVWVVAWEGTQNLKPEERAIQIVQPMLDWRLKGKSAWLRSAEQRIRNL
ncbi:methylenetetrahydrofolate reductase C-terminal domain-containing protein [Thiothrix eikelboomii]|uniref:methylenetetrahydrofolate reductase C-terminal domain-containing protein n=1 Tax=Thiothrix eikelboomii TaxID=92487 RepID=UPI003BB21077